MSGVQNKMDKSKISAKKFSVDIQNEIEEAKNDIKNLYHLNPGNNINLICEKLNELKDVEGVYAECGVFQGNTIFSVANYIRKRSLKRDIVGFDTFEGFPDISIDFRDRPIFFKELYKNNDISKDHYDKAALRTNNFNDEKHLKKDYFLDVNKVFSIAEDFENVKLIRGDFRDTLKRIDCKIAVLFLDCDLYGSYHVCLENLFQKVVKNGVIVFDEYYSLKYPGARLAVNEYFQDKNGEMEKYITDEGFERWCFVKN